jgi:hypothetical protein
MRLLLNQLNEMNQQNYRIRNAIPAEYTEIGEFMAEVYSQLAGFPKETDQPGYYKMLRQIGTLTENPETELLVAVSFEGHASGVYYGDMKYYGSGGSATGSKIQADSDFLPSTR